MSPVNGTRRALVRALATLALIAGAMLGVLSATAQAKQITATISPAPEQGLATTVTFTGTAPAGADSNLTAVARPAGSAPCAATPAADQAAASAGTQTLVSGAGVAPGAYSVPATWTPAHKGDYIVCAWLQQPTPTTPTTIGPVTTAVKVGHPQATVSAAVSPGRVAGTAFTVSFATQSDQPLALFASVRHSGGGCAASHKAENARPGAMNLTSGGIPVPAGAGSASVTPTLPAGQYLVCAYLEGPDPAEVAAVQSLAFDVAAKPTPPPPPSKIDPTLALTSATASAATGISITGTTAPTFEGPLKVTLQCGLVTLKQRITAAAGAFSTTSTLPSGCVAGNVVEVRVISPAREHFKADVVTAAVTVTAPPVAHHPRARPRLLSAVHRHGNRVTNVFLVRPRHIRVALSVGGPLTLFWSRWTRFGARGHGTAHPGKRRFAVRVHATHPTHGHFACLAVTARHHGRRHTIRLALARVPGSRPLAWVPVGQLGPHSRYRAVTRRGCR